MKTARRIRKRTESASGTNLRKEEERSEEVAVPEAGKGLEKVIKWGMIRKDGTFYV